MKAKFCNFSFSFTMDLDSYQDEIGGISNYQIAIIAVVCITSFGTAFTSQAAIFISAVPDHRCEIRYIEGNEGNCNLTESDIKNLTIPIEGESYSSCSRYAYNYTECASECDISCLQDQVVSTESCKDGYTYDHSVYGETTTSQFDLVCDRRYLDTISQTLFFVGFFIGSAIVGPLCDWFGRRRAILLLSIALVGSSIGVAFSPNYDAFVATRVLAGAFNIANFIAVFTYVCEIANTKHRTEASAWVNFSSGAAHTVFAGFAYFIRNWRHLQLLISLIPAAYIFMYPFLPETPRWLLVKGRYEEARKVISRYAKSKGKTLSDETWKLILKAENEMNASNEENKAVKVRVWDLFRRPLMRLLCFNVMFSWFTVSMVFYGLALNGGNLAGDPYLNNALNGLVEIFAYFAMYFAVVWGRVPILSGGFICAGLFCISSMLCDLFSNGSTGLLTTSTVFAITGKFFASNAFAMIYTVTSEIFPTSARATGMSVGSMAARVGGMLSPLVLEVQRTVPWFTQTLFGILSVLAGVFSLIYPETAKTDYITSMDEAEEYYRKNMKVLRFCRKKDSFDRENSYDSESYMEEKKATRL